MGAARDAQAPKWKWNLGLDARDLKDDFESLRKSIDNLKFWYLATGVGVVLATAEIVRIHNALLACSRQPEPQTFIRQNNTAPAPALRPDPPRTTPPQAPRPADPWPRR